MGGRTKTKEDGIRIMVREAMGFSEQIIGNNSKINDNRFLPVCLIKYLREIIATEREIQNLQPIGRNLDENQ